MDGTSQVVARILPPNYSLSNLDPTFSEADYAALLAMSAEERKALISLGFSVDTHDPPDFSIFPSLRNVEIVFAQPMDLPFEPSSPRGRAHREQRIATAERWLSALPADLEWLRLGYGPAEALHALPYGLRRLELDPITGGHEELSFAGIEAAHSLHALVIEDDGGRRFDVRGLWQLRELTIRDPRRAKPVDPTVLLDMPALQRLTVGALDMGVMWGHPSLETIDVRDGVIEGWPPQPRGLFPALRRLILVGATGPAKAPLARHLSPPLVLYSAQDELRATLSCLSMVAVRWRTRVTFVSQDSTVASVELASTLRPILASAFPLLDAHEGEFQVEIDLYDGSSVLTISPSADCKRLNSWKWQNGYGALALPDEAAKRLCRWLGDSRRLQGRGKGAPQTLPPTTRTPAGL